MPVLHFFATCVSIDLHRFFFNDTATTEIYTLSLHDALPISRRKLLIRIPRHSSCRIAGRRPALRGSPSERPVSASIRSEEHTSELQSRQYLVCRLLLEKKKNLVFSLTNTKQPTISHSPIPCP